MYRIKEKVSLKKLKRFGYEKEDNLYVKKVYKTSDYTYFEVFVNMYTREINAYDGYSFSFYINDDDIEKVIEDLIKANMIERL